MGVKVTATRKYLTLYVCTHYNTVQLYNNHGGGFGSKILTFLVLKHAYGFSKSMNYEPDGNVNEKD